MTHPFDTAVDSIRSWAMCDSMVRVDLFELRAALSDDSETAGRLPTEPECQALVCGDDEGDVPLNLQLAFPRTRALLGRYWG